jgi:hypothetical protein
MRKTIAKLLYKLADAINPEIRKIASINKTTITLEEPISFNVGDEIIISKR